MAAGFNSGSAALPYQLDGIVLGNVQVGSNDEFLAIPVSGGFGDAAWYAAHQGVANGEMFSGYLSGAFGHSGAKASGSIVQALNYLKSQQAAGLTVASPTEAVQFNNNNEFGGSANFGFYGGLVNISGSGKLEFGDGGQYIQSSVNGQLDLVASGEVEITTAKLDVDATDAVDIHGAAASSILTTSGDLDINAADKIIIQSAENQSDAVTFTMSGGSSAGFLGLVNSATQLQIGPTFVALGTSAPLNVNNVTNSTSTSTGALKVAGGLGVAKDLNLGNGATGGSKLALISDSTNMMFGADQEILLGHLADTGLLFSEPASAATATSADLQFRDSTERIQTLRQSHLGLVANNGTNGGLGSLVALSASKVSLADALQVGAASQGRNMYVSGNISAGPTDTILANSATVGSYVSGTTLRLAGSDRWGNSKYFELSVKGGLLKIVSGSH